jgi:hypothetical protein
MEASSALQYRQRAKSVREPAFTPPESCAHDNQILKRPAIRFETAVWPKRPADDATSHDVAAILGSAPAEQRATVSACAGLLLAHKSAGPALSIKPLALGVINTLLKIEPDDSVVRAVLLRLQLGLKQAQLRRRMARVACSH